ncbi:hypothetical protein HDU86_007631 [Geranomyces michiganensis]|nr:hypothetical protein HDU86_007631 [Geranomyces michiganensis]
MDGLPGNVVRCIVLHLSPAGRVALACTSKALSALVSPFDCALLRFEELLAQHASTLTIVGPNADMHLSYRDPIADYEISAFTWVSIIYCCAKQRNWTQALAQRHQLPLEVFKWLEKMAALWAFNGGRAAGLNFSAELRTVCLQHLAQVGFKRALSMYDLYFNFPNVSPASGSARTFGISKLCAWFFQTVTVAGPPPNSFPYYDDVRVKIRSVRTGSKYTGGERTMDLHIQYFRPFQRSTWIPFLRSHFHYIPLNDDTYTTPQSFPLRDEALMIMAPAAVLWALNRQEIDNLKENRRLSAGAFFISTKFRDKEWVIQAEMEALEQEFPFRCYKCNSTDGAPDRVTVFGLRKARLEWKWSSPRPKESKFLRYRIDVPTNHNALRSRRFDFSDAITVGKCLFISTASIKRVGSFPQHQYMSQVDSANSIAQLVRCSRRIKSVVESHLPLFTSAKRALASLSTFVVLNSNVSMFDETVLAKMAAIRDTLSYARAGFINPVPCTNRTRCVALDGKLQAWRGVQTRIVRAKGQQSLFIGRFTNDEKFRVWTFFLATPDLSKVYKWLDIFLPCGRDRIDGPDWRDVDMSVQPHVLLAPDFGFTTFDSALGAFKRAFPLIPRRKVSCKARLASQHGFISDIGGAEREAAGIWLPVFVPPDVTQFGALVENAPKLPLSSQLAKAAFAQMARVAMTASANINLLEISEMFFAVGQEQIDSVMPGAKIWVARNVRYTDSFVNYGKSYDPDDPPFNIRGRQHQTWNFLGVRSRFSLKSQDGATFDCHFLGEQDKLYVTNGKSAGGPLLMQTWRYESPRFNRATLVDLQDALGLQRWDSVHFATLLYVLCFAVAAYEIKKTAEKVVRGPAWNLFEKLSGSITLCDDEELQKTDMYDLPRSIAPFYYDSCEPDDADFGGRDTVATDEENERDDPVTRFVR